MCAYLQSFFEFLCLVLFLSVPLCFHYTSSTKIIYGLPSV